MRGDCANRSSQGWGVMTAAFFDKQGNLSTTSGCDFHRLTVQVPPELKLGGGHTEIDVIVALEKGSSLAGVRPDDPLLLASGGSEPFSWFKHPNKIQLAKESPLNHEVGREVLDKFVELVCRSIVRSHPTTVNKEVEAHLASEIAGKYGVQLKEVVTTTGEDIHGEDASALEEEWPFKILATNSASKRDYWVSKQDWQSAQKATPWPSLVTGFLARCKKVIVEHPKLTAATVLSGTAAAGLVCAYMVSGDTEQASNAAVAALQSMLPITENPDEWPNFECTTEQFCESIDCQSDTMTCQSMTGSIPLWSDSPCNSLLFTGGWSLEGRFDSALRALSFPRLGRIATEMINATAQGFLVQMKAQGRYGEHAFLNLHCCPSGYREYCPNDTVEGAQVPYGISDDSDYGSGSGDYGSYITDYNDE